MRTFQILTVTLTESTYLQKSYLTHPFQMTGFVIKYVTCSVVPRLMQTAHHHKMHFRTPPTEAHLLRTICEVSV
jgi:hypothetical protein